MQPLPGIIRGLNCGLELGIAVLNLPGTPKYYRHAWLSYGTSPTFRDWEAPDMEAYATSPALTPALERLSALYTIGGGDDWWDSIDGSVEPENSIDHLLLGSPLNRIVAHRSGYPHPSGPYVINAYAPLMGREGRRIMDAQSQTFDEAWELLDSRLAALRKKELDRRIEEGLSQLFG